VSSFWGPLQPIAQIASAYGIHPNQLYKWKAQAFKGLPDLFEDNHKTEKVLQASHERELEALYTEIGRLNVQLTWLKKIWHRAYREVNVTN